MKCVACEKELSADEMRWGDILGFYECLACREKRTAKRSTQEEKIATLVHSISTVVKKRKL